MSHSNAEPHEEDEHEGDLGRLFKEFSQAHEDEDVPRTQELTLKAWAEMARHMEGMPESTTLREWNKAHEREAAFDGAGAEAAFLRAIEAEAAKEQPAGRGYHHLSTFYSFVGRDEDALRAACMATEQARLSPGWMAGVTLVQALQGQAALELKRGDTLTARALVEESLRVGDNEKVMQLPRLFGQLYLAQCALADGDLDETLAELDALWPRLEPWRDAMMLTSWQAALAS